MNENELILSNLKQLADTVAKTFTSSLEVVIHDLSKPQNSIIYIAGNVTDRQVGGPVTDLVLQLLHQEGNNIQDRYNYKTISKDGRELKSSTAFIKNSSGEVVAAFCINFDITQCLNAQQVLEMLTSTDDAYNNNESFATTVDETIDSLFDKVVHKIGKQPASMTKQERIELVTELENLGVFQIKGSIEHVGIRMGVSKYTIYNYLKTNKARHVLQQF